MTKENTPAIQLVELSVLSSQQMTRMARKRNVITPAVFSAVMLVAQYTNACNKQTVDSAALLLLPLDTRYTLAENDRRSYFGNASHAIRCPSIPTSVLKEAADGFTKYSHLNEGFWQIAIAIDATWKAAKVRHSSFRLPLCSSQYTVRRCFCKVRSSSHNRRLCGHEEESKDLDTGQCNSKCLRTSR